MPTASPLAVGIAGVLAEVTVREDSDLGEVRLPYRTLTVSFCHLDDVASNVHGAVVVSPGRTIASIVDVDSVVGTQISITKITVAAQINEE